jgi:hypothetical protein
MYERFEMEGKLQTIEAMAVHLDSDYSGHNKRNDQLQWLYSKTRQEDTICIMGDYNFHIDSEDKSFEKAGTRIIFLLLVSLNHETERNF